MDNYAIRVKNISKQYKITTTKYRHDTIRDLMVETIKSAFGRNGRPSAGEDSFWALKDVSFEVKRGEIVGMIGRNGAGKSTLLKVLSRITEPTEGYAEILGRVGSLLEVGTGFHSELTGRENIFLNGAIIGMRKEEIRRQFDAIVDFSEIGKFIDTPVKRYSSGMYVRLAFAVAAHLKPEILMLDEVLSVGDLEFQRKCMTHAKNLQKSNATVLFVSHNMFAVRDLCTRVIYLSGGRIRSDDKTEKVISLYERESALGTEMRVNSGRIKQAQQPIQIRNIEIFDNDGKVRTVFEYGERMRVRLWFEALEKIKDPNFVVAFVRADDVPCCNYNTAMDGFVIPPLAGEGVIELLTPPLKLISESYSIHILVWDKDFQRRYGMQKGPNFQIRHHLLNTHFGIFHEEAEWFWPAKN